MDDVRRVVAEGAYPRFFHALLARGVVFAPGPYEVLFPGLAHGDGRAGAGDRGGGGGGGRGGGRLGIDPQRLRVPSMRPSGSFLAKASIAE